MYDSDSLLADLFIMSYLQIRQIFIFIFKKILLRYDYHFIDPFVEPDNEFKPRASQHIQAQANL